ncbi:MAG: hypothetical protein OXF68_07715 [Gammaproteobacteria bacterium]|nr:hypothetical protein [Gammaproteobacteria bacterium]
MKIGDLARCLALDANDYEGLPVHVAAFCSYLIQQDNERLDAHSSLRGDDQSYQKVAAAGYALAKRSFDDPVVGSFKAALEHLAGRTYFVEGRVPRFEIDSIALLGVALGAKATGISPAHGVWLHELLQRTSRMLEPRDWQSDLVAIAKGVVDPNCRTSTKDPRVAVAFVKTATPGEVQSGWSEMITRVGEDEPVQIALNRAVFDRCAAALAALPIAESDIAGLIASLEGLAQSMSHWTYETHTRVKRVPMEQWEIRHEYHVQNLLWTVLRPVYADLVDEEFLPKVGHKAPRYDLGVPSLETIIEVKFMRRAGPAACREITEEVAADCSLYLTPSTRYSTLIIFIWDECRQTEEYQTLKAGLEGLEGIKKVIILPRPSRMEVRRAGSRPNSGDSKG